MSYYITVLQKYFDFSGRATRSEFWWFALFHFIIAVVLAVLSVAAEWLMILYILYGLGTLIPALGVTVRRLHDTGRSGWWYFITFVPLIGFFILLVFLVGGSDNENRYGPRPA